MQIKIIKPNRIGLIFILPMFITLGCNVSNNINYREETDLQDLNDRLRGLGWDEFELDDHTLQLIIANIEKQIHKSKRQENVFFDEQTINERSRPLSP